MNLPYPHHRQSGKPQANPHPQVIIKGATLRHVPDASLEKMDEMGFVWFQKRVERRRVTLIAHLRLAGSGGGCSKSSTATAVVAPVSSSAEHAKAKEGQVLRSNTGRKYLEDNDVGSSYPGAQQAGSSSVRPMERSNADEPSSSSAGAAAGTFVEDATALNRKNAGTTSRDEEDKESNGMHSQRREAWRKQSPSPDDGVNSVDTEIFRRDVRDEDSARGLELLSLQLELEERRKECAEVAALNSKLLATLNEMEVWIEKEQRESKEEIARLQAKVTSLQDGKEIVSAQVSSLPSTS